MEKADIGIIGGGVIGLALARQLSEKGQSVVLLEKNKRLGQGISSRNSEVIHAGIYHPANYLKTSLCVRGNVLLYEFCERFQVPYIPCGKIIVANSDSEQEQLHTLAQRAENNGITNLQFLSRETLAELEPSVRAKYALLSPSTGVIDSHGFLQRLEKLCLDQGVDFALNTEVTAIQRERGTLGIVCSGGYELRCGRVINAAGLGAASLATAIAGFPLQQLPHITFVKGNYFSYRGKSPFRHLIYPVPEFNGQRSSLGIHATLDLNGNLRFGPDAEPVEDEDYRVNLAAKEYFVQAITGYFPALDADRLQPDFAGIRPRLKIANNKMPDFQIQESGQHGINGLINLFGIESPGLTASLAIAEYIEKQLTR